MRDDENSKICTPKRLVYLYYRKLMINLLLDDPLVKIISFSNRCHKLIVIQSNWLLMVVYNILLELLQQELSKLLIMIKPTTLLINFSKFALGNQVFSFISCLFNNNVLDIIHNTIQRTTSGQQLKYSF